MKKYLSDGSERVRITESGRYYGYKGKIIGHSFASFQTNYIIQLDNGVIVVAPSRSFEWLLVDNEKTENPVAVSKKEIQKLKEQIQVLTEENTKMKETQKLWNAKLEKAKKSLETTEILENNDYAQGFLMGAEYILKIIDENK